MDIIIDTVKSITTIFRRQEEEEDAQELVRYPTTPFSQYFLRKPDFVLPLTFFPCDDVDVLCRYSKEVEKRTGSAFVIGSSKIQNKYGFYLLLKMPEHCGFKEKLCDIGPCQEEMMKYWNMIAKEMADHIHQMHRWAAFVYPDKTKLP